MGEGERRGGKEGRERERARDQSARRSLRDAVAPLRRPPLCSSSPATPKHAHPTQHTHPKTTDRNKTKGPLPQRGRGGLLPLCVQALGPARGGPRADAAQRPGRRRAAAVHPVREGEAAAREKGGGGETRGKREKNCSPPTPMRTKTKPNQTKPTHNPHTNAKKNLS